MTLRLVIFDCDGVLVDSEGPAARLTARELTGLGWPLTADEAMHRFVGYTLADMMPVIEAHLGRTLPPDWVPSFRRKMIETLSAEVEPMPGAADVLRAVAALGLPYRIASNSSHEEMRVKFARTGLAELVGERAHSARDVPRGKPAPDVFLAAAAAEGVPPAACVVVEDSVPGAMAAAAAGMPCFGLAPHGEAAALQATGAALIRSLAELPPLLRAMQA